MCGLHRAIDVFFGGVGDLGDRLAGRWILDFDLVVTAAVDPFAVDPKPRLHGQRGVARLRYRCKPARRVTRWGRWQPSSFRRRSPDPKAKRCSNDANVRWP